MSANDLERNLVLLISWVQCSVQLCMKVIMAIAFGSLLLTGCSFFGIRSGSEQPQYQVIDNVDENLEVRLYASRLAAEVQVEESNEEKGRNAAFRVLFDYITGANIDQASIDMTTPVETSEQPRKIAMTAPVTQSGARDARKA